MAVAYTRRLGLVTLPSGLASQVIATAAEGNVTILRDVLVANEAGVAQIVQLYLKTRYGNATVFHDAAMPTATVAHLDIRQELKPGDQLVGISVQGSVNVVATGYVFFA